MKKIKKLMLSTLLGLTILGSINFAGICDEHWYSVCMDNAHASGGSAFVAIANSCYANFRDCN